MAIQLNVKQDGTKVITGEAVLSYPRLDEPTEKGKYEATLVFVPDAEKRTESLAALNKAVEQAAFDKFGQAGLDRLKKKQMRHPFRDDAEAKGYPEGSIFFGARTQQKPGLVLATAGADGKPLACPTDKIKDEFYPGARVRASVRAFYYDKDGNKGIGFALDNLQKLREGTRLDSRVAAANEFDADLSAAPAALEDITA